MGTLRDWVKVDTRGDGVADGYMHGSFLNAISGGFPAHSISALTTSERFQSPYLVAQAEMTLGVAEAPGSANNPRIVMYHNSTTGAAGTADSVAWCSSFVNFCVETAGMKGTDSQWALSWATWGVDASSNPREGDIVVFERVGEGGHVGFLRADLGSHVTVLGGNQGNRVNLSNYPKDGLLGGFRYMLRAIRRG
jgi:uncharacterized protein (TIGR02594 family)